MTLPAMKIDDLNFEQLVEQARSLIPRYAPEWTDHNIHDPGITLLELLSWIVEQEVYQLGFVSDRHLRAFAALLGVHPKLAYPAKGLIWPNRQADNPHLHVVVAESTLERGTKVSLVQQPNLSFILDTDIHLSAAQPLQAGHARAVNASESIDLTQLFQQPNASFNLRPDKHDDEILELQFDGPLVENGDKPVSLGIEVNPVVSADLAAAPPWGPLVFEYQSHNSLPWQAVEVVEDRTFALAKTGVVLIKIPADKSAAQPRLRLRLDQGYYPVPIQIIRVELNVLPIVQLEEVSRKTIGTSNALPDQTFDLNTEGLPESDCVSAGDGENKFPGSPQIEVFTADQTLSWNQTANLSRHNPKDRVYVVDEVNGQIKFGNGINGKIPEKNAQVQHGDYYLTKGHEGNLRSGFDWRVANASVQGSLFGTNPEHFLSGEDAWDINRLMTQARKRVRERQILLSDEDLLGKVKDLDGFAVARADLLKNYHPSLPNEKISGTRTLVITPQREAGEPAATSEKLQRYLQEVRTAIEPYRVLGERLAVTHHKKVEIQIKATLLIESGEDGDSIRQSAINKLKARLTDISDSSLQTYNSISDIVEQNASLQPWPLGRAVSLAEIKTLLANVAEVIAVPDCEMATLDQSFAGQTVIKLMPDEVAVMTTEPVITINYTEQR